MVNHVTLRIIEYKIGIKRRSWPGSCHSIAKKILDAGLVKGKLRYGHWLGKVKKGTMFDTGSPFQRHGWIEMKNSIIFDATRWVFEGIKPYIFIGKANGEYDAGGQNWRAALLSPPPRFDDSPEIKFKVTNKASQFLLDKLNYPYFTIKGLFWIANLPLDDLGIFAKEIYRELDRMGQRAFIPVDNYSLAME